MKCRYLATSGFRYPARYEPGSEGEYTEKEKKHILPLHLWNKEQMYPFGTKLGNLREKSLQTSFYLDYGKSMANII